MARASKITLAVVGYAVLAICGITTAAAQCAGGGGGLDVSGTVSPALSSYNPFSTVPQSQVFSFTIVNSETTDCSVSIAFLRPGLPTMSKGGDTLGYDITSGGSNIVFSGSTPAPGNRVDLTIAGNNGSAVVTYRVEVEDGQAVSAGAYLDAGVSLEFFERDAGGTLTGTIKSIAASVSDTVASICDFPTPSVTSLNFTSRIVNAVPTSQPLVLEVPGVQCTTPAFIKLSGDAMRQNPSPSPLANFDHFINYSAAATLGSASVTLTTSEVAGSDTATSAGVTSGLANGAVDLSIGLVPGKPVQAGHYESILTLEIIPEF